jgi:starvation-inducible DNA-binding protein
MTSVAHPSHLPPLGSHRIEDAGKELQATLVELVALSLLGKQLHWNVTGQLFRPLHLHLDELVDSWRELSDTVAERAVAIGFAPDGRAPTVVADSGITPVDAGPIQDHAVVQALADRLAAVAEKVRERAERLADIDIASQDVLIEVMRALEEQLWMIRAQFRGAGEA